MSGFVGQTPVPETRYTHLDIVIKRDNIPMATGQAFQGRDFISDLQSYYI
jgi:hypothetical protein